MACLLTGLVAVLLLGLWGMPSGTAGAASVAPRPPSASIRIQEFNIEWGGTHVSFDKVAEAIVASGADVACIEEAQGHIPALAAKLGWPYYSARQQIVSKLPLIDPPRSQGVYLYVQYAPGSVVALSNVHLPSYPDGVAAAAAGKSAAAVRAIERGSRLEAIQPQLAALPPLVTAGIPTFLVGDFNAPSYLDWTAATVGLRPQIKYPLVWPVSKAVADAGFRDSWRDVYPDPVANPGLTWWAARPKIKSWNPGAKDPQDRIDFIYAAGSSVTTASQIVGEAGGPEVSFTVTPWPSDHRSVVSTFGFTPGTPPDLVSVDRRLLTVGDDLKVIFHAPGAAGEHVALALDSENPALAAVADQPTGAAGTTDGTLTFSTAGFAPGSYRANLLDQAGTVLARIGFWVTAPGAEPQVWTGKRTYRSGEPVVAHWKNAPGNRWDWVCVSTRGTGPGSCWTWQYTRTFINGKMRLDRREPTPGWGPQYWPLPAGRYTVYLMRDDGYARLASNHFTVR
jgi:endonuclease/exonuclease/phosphatase family metal-dependent hydrolase